VASSIGFISNIFYWSESGYFDASSHEKWLLHTWSLSVEWQFYIIYPLALVAMQKFMSISKMKVAVVFGTILGFIICVIATYKWPDSSYFLLHTRVWEMMVGGVAYLYPFTLQVKNKKVIERVGLTLIVCSCFLITKESPWPGYLALFAVLGTFFVIQAQRNDSFITSNVVAQKLGAWSYSIYLWHWPVVVVIYYFSLNKILIYPGIALSVLLGFVSNKYIEKVKFKNNFKNLFSYLKCIPVNMVLIVGVLGSLVFINNGFYSLASPEYQYLFNNTKPSPYRNKCHISKYQPPVQSCEYFGTNITWATFGDSHSTEIAYALAEKLKLNGVGIKHFSFSGCLPSYKESAEFSLCSQWYNESVNYILNDEKIKNVVFNHRFTNQLIGGNANNYPDSYSYKITEKAIRMANHIDDLIIRLAASKDNVYIFYPIPELPDDISKLTWSAYKNEDGLLNIVGTDLAWYEERNKYVITHFDNANYPVNVHLLKPQDVFCDDENCFAVKDGEPLYFDNNHPSKSGAAKLIELII
jgi:hypothetical protein